jgi:hypothetical protein
MRTLDGIGDHLGMSTNPKNDNAHTVSDHFP